MKKHTEKSFIKKSASILLCGFFMLIAIFGLTGCSEPESIPFTLDTGGSSEGVALEGTTLLMNVGQFAEIICSKDVKSVSASRDTIGYVRFYQENNEINIIPVNAGTHYNAEIIFRDNSSSVLSIYVRNSTCPNCENSFNITSEYLKHTRPCGHTCVSSSPDEHSACANCKMYLCNEEHKPHFADCGHTLEEAANGLEHKTVADCGYHFLCTGKNHQPFVCGHYLCNGGDMNGHNECQNCESFICDGKEHEKLGCGHYTCDGGEHTVLDCGIHGSCTATGEHGKAECGEHFLCDNKEHTLGACQKHFNCEDGDHKSMANCGKHYKCEGGNHNYVSKEKCGEHYACEDGRHNERASCLKHFKCQLGEHNISVCRTHYMCEGGDHNRAPCDMHYACQEERYMPSNHALADCNTHFVCEGGVHGIAPCGTHYMCESGEHYKALCNTHYSCESGDHDIAPCNLHYSCEGGEHDKADCNLHYKCEGGEHYKAECGHPACLNMIDHSKAECGEHFVCNGGMHGLADCMEHYICENCTHEEEDTMDCGCPIGSEGEHELLECGHYACEEGDHYLDSCDEHWICIDGYHGNAECGHPLCKVSANDPTHTAYAPCGEHYICLGWDECSQFNDCGEHYLCLTLYDNSHTDDYLMACGVHHLCQVDGTVDHSVTSCGHFGCEIEEGGESHTTMADCGTHYICHSSECSLCQQN